MEYQLSVLWNISVCWITLIFGLAGHVYKYEITNWQHSVKCIESPVTAHRESGQVSLKIIEFNSIYLVTIYIYMQ